MNSNDIEALIARLKLYQPGPGGYNSQFNADIQEVVSLLEAPVQRSVVGLTSESLTKALRRAYHLGQTYWMQADSESYAQNKRADATAKKFKALVRDVVSQLESVTLQNPHAWEVLNAGVWESTYRCRKCGMAVSENTEGPEKPKFGCGEQ